MKILPTNDLRLVYHVACTLGEVTSGGCLETRLSKLCTSERINQFSKWKPVRYNGTQITEAILKSLNYGLTITSAHSPADLVTAINERGTHQYNRPLGGANSPYRLGDFRNYDAGAVLPCHPLGEQDIRNGGNATTRIDGILNPQTATSLGYDNFYPEELHRGIFMINSAGHMQWCTDEIAWRNIPNKDYWQTGEITCYDFYTNVQKAINGAYNSNQSDIFYAVTSDALHPNPYKWILTGERPPSSDYYYFHVLATQTADNIYVNYRIVMSSKGDVYIGGTAKNISIALTTEKNGVYPVNSAEIASSYTIGPNEEKVWEGEISIPSEYRDKNIYIQLFADGSKQFESMVAKLPSRE